MEVELRLEEEKDYRIVEELTREAGMAMFLDVMNTY